MAKIEDIIFNFREFAPRFLKIKDEFGRIIPLEFNSAQLRVLRIIEEIWASGKPLRLIILKARQEGISTLIQAFIFWYLLTTPNQKGLTMGHKLDASNNLFDMYKRFYDNLPKIMQPKLLRSNEKKISYAKLGSENKIETAGSGEIGRSDTFQVLHLTEAAYFPDIKTSLVGLMQGAKYAKIQVIESTANGYNEFHKLWVDAKEGKGGFVPIFLSWLDFPEYVENAKKLGFLDKYEKLDLGNPLYNEYPEEEKILKEKYGATDDQLRFRRYMIDSPAFAGDIQKFHQEYPTTDEEAFLASGRPVFNQNIVQKNLAESKEPLKVGDLIPIYSEEGRKRAAEGASYLELKEYMEGVEFVENKRGFIKIWTEPERIDGEVMYRFAGGADVAEGLEQGDYSVLRVYDRLSSEVHLTWHGHIDPDLFAEEIHKIWWFLDKDLVVGVEKNNHGLSVINKLFELDVPQYYRENFRNGYPQTTRNIGFTTDRRTKPFMINLLNEYIREGLYKDYEHEFWQECRTFVKNARGQMQAEGKDRDPSIKNFDDRVMAEAIMLVVSEWLPNIHITKPDEMPARPTLVNKKGGATKF